MTMEEGGAVGKRVSWVELYFDLVFVFAVGQVAHHLIVEPTWRAVLSTLAVFATLWWTWIGFVLLYNRRGDDRRLLHRLVILAGTVPCAIAATQAHGVFEHHGLGFALALAGTRLVLAIGYLASTRRSERAFARRAALGYGLSGILFVLAAVLSALGFRPIGFVLWGYAILQEGVFLLLRRDRAGRRARARARGRAGDRDGDRDGGRDGGVRELVARLSPPADPSHAVDAPHLAERFGLFMIILLGEIVISIGNAASDYPDHDAGYWLSLCGGLVLAGGLWWIYFTSAADINESLLTASGGNPALAHTLYAGGHLIPAYSLLVIAAGISLSLHPDPPPATAWFIAAGIAGYLAGTRAFAVAVRGPYAAAPGLVVVAATVALALLGRVVSAPVLVALAAGWVVVAATVVTVTRSDHRRLAEDPVAYLRR